MLGRGAAEYTQQRLCVVRARFDLGDKAPQINGIKVYQGERIEDEVNIEVDVMWSGRQAREPALGRHVAQFPSAAQCLAACKELLVAHKHRSVFVMLCSRWLHLSALAAQRKILRDLPSKQDMQTPAIAAKLLIGRYKKHL